MTPTEVQKAIVAITRDIGQDGIGKNARNKEQGYSYRGIDDVLNSLSPLYAKHGVFVRPTVLERDLLESRTAKGNPLWKVTVKVEYEVVSCLDGSREKCIVYGEAMDSADKATNKAMSAAYKYLAIQLFAIPVEGQDDADAHTPEVATTITSQHRDTLLDLARTAGLTEDGVLAGIEKATGLQLQALMDLPLAAFPKIRQALYKKAEAAINQEQGATA